MGQGLSAKDSLPPSEVEYVHRDEFGNAVKMRRHLSHTERYELHGKANERGQITMGIHRTLFHHTKSATVGKGKKIEREGFGVGAFKTKGDKVDKYGRPYTALELLKKAENDRKIEEARLARKKREEMYQSVNSQYSSIALNAADARKLPAKSSDEPALIAFNRQSVMEEAKRGNTVLHKTAGRAGLKALEERIAERNRQHLQEEESKKPPVLNTFSNTSDSSNKASAVRRHYWNDASEGTTGGNENTTSSTAADVADHQGRSQGGSTSPYVVDRETSPARETERQRLPPRRASVSPDSTAVQERRQSIGERFRELQRSQSDISHLYTYEQQSAQVEANENATESAASRRWRNHEHRATDGHIEPYHSQGHEARGPSVRARVGALPYGWVQYWDPNEKKHYYYHAVRKVSQWEVPVIVAEKDTYMNASFRRKRFKLMCEIGAWNAMNIKGEQLKLRRSDMMEDSYNHIMRLDYNGLKAKMRIVYAGETGIDSGGLTKDWYLEISRRLLSKESQLCLFQESTQGIYVIDPRSKLANDDYIRYYRFYGRLIAKAIYDRHVIDSPLCTAFWKKLIGKIPSIDDVKEIDSVYYSSLQWILANDIEGVVEETFSVIREEFGAYVTVDLVPGGREIDVTNENKELYVQAVVDYICGGSVSEQIGAICNGVYELVPKSTLLKFNASELKELVNGKDRINVNELRESIRYTGGFEGTLDHVTIKCFWAAMESFSQSTLEDVLRFITGTSKIPLDGFDPPLTITRSDVDVNSLPTAHTCFNQLVLPEYQTREMLVEKLMYGVKHVTGFHLT